MKREIQQRQPIDLGPVSERTLGTGDRAPDFVGLIPKTGISDE